MPRLPQSDNLGGGICADGLMWLVTVAFSRYEIRNGLETHLGQGEKDMGMRVGVLDHYNVSTRNLPETIKFYETVLGFVNGPRPPFAFPGAWLYSGDHPVLHLNDISPTDREQRPDSGVIDHVALAARGFEAMKGHLTAKGVPFRANQVPNSTRWQLFFRDPNNVEIELNFETKNEMAG
jgi:catechol 2,3-dioxygenase-like lactoylglutathione lyase family enzyme